VNGEAAAYDAWYETPLGRAPHQIELALVERLAQPVAGETALDAGCGTGIYTAWLAERGLELTGIDVNPGFLEAARRRAPAARLVEGTVTRLPFADGEFDLTLAVTLFCFLSREERAAAARELVRVTRPGGRMVVGELARLSLWAAQRRLKGWLGSETWRAARFTSAGELRRLLRDAGATAISSRYALYLPPLDTRLVTHHAETIERLARPLGPLGAAFVAARADFGERS
jgi:ubiquinone/menaquinone biosynthesis C-methylase UbiE